MITILTLCLAVAAHAEHPLPSYREEANRAAWFEVNEHLERGRRTGNRDHLDEAIRQAERYQRVVGETAGLQYLIGLAFQLEGRADRAERHFLRSIALDDTAPDVWWDLGELYRAGGRLEEAHEAYDKVARLRPTLAIAHQRLAEVAATMHDPDGFETHIREALRHGFSFEHVADIPVWRSYYADPVMRDSLTKMVTVYGTPESLRQLRREP